jgi:hypothetical protein
MGNLCSSGLVLRLVIRNMLVANCIVTLERTYSSCNVLDVYTKTLCASGKDLEVLLLYPQD